MDTIVKVGIGVGAAVAVGGVGFWLYRRSHPSTAAALPAGAPAPRFAPPPPPAPRALPGAPTSLSTLQGAPLYQKGVTLYTADGQVYPTGKTRLVRSADGFDVYMDENGRLRLKNGIQMFTSETMQRLSVTPLNAPAPAPAPPPSAPPSSPSIVEQAADLYGQGQSTYEQGKSLYDKGSALLEGLGGGGGGGGGGASADISAKFSAAISGSTGLATQEKARAAALARMYSRRRFPMGM
jgi:hypothetical protein